MDEIIAKENMSKVDENHRCKKCFLGF